MRRSAPLAPGLVPGTSWTVLGPAAARRNHHNYVRAQCACGREREVSEPCLRARQTRACAVCAHRRYPEPAAGAVYADWKVIARAADRIRADGHGRWPYWRCRCLLCGDEHEVRELSLVRGDTKNCRLCAAYAASLSRKERAALAKKRNAAVGRTAAPRGNENDDMTTTTKRHAGAMGEAP